MIKSRYVTEQSLTPKKAVTIIATIDRIARAALKRVINTEAKVDQISKDKTVHGMDIYIQSTEPSVAGDLIWINTNGINSILK